MADTMRLATVLAAERKYVKTDANGCQRLHEIARGALKAEPFIHVGESEDCGKYVGKLFERR